MTRLMTTRALITSIHHGWFRLWSIRRSLPRRARAGPRRARAGWGSRAPRRRRPRRRRGEAPPAAPAEPSVPPGAERTARPVRAHGNLGSGLDPALGRVLVGQLD